MENRSDYLPYPEGPAGVLLRILFVRNRRRLAFAVCALIVLLAVIFQSAEAFEYWTEALAPAYAYAPQSGEAVSQNLAKEERILRAFRIRFDTYERTNIGEIEVRFFKNGKEVKNWAFSAAELADDAYREFPFDRQVKTTADDACYFTVTQVYEGINWTGIWMTGPIPEEEQVSEEEGGQDAEEGAVRTRTENSVLCYQLALQDKAMQTSITVPFVLALTLLFAAAAVLVSFSRMSLVRLITATLFVFVLIGTVSSDLFQRIVRDVPVCSYADESSKLMLAPGETMEESFQADLCGFSSVEFSISAASGRSESVHVRLVQEDSGETVYEGTIGPADMLAGGPGGRRIRISAAQTAEGKLFPMGNYRLYVTNADQEKKLRICVREVAVAQAAAIEDTVSEGDDAKDSSAGSGDNREGKIPEKAGTEEAAAAQEQVELHLNIALHRTSALGYRIACIIFLLLGVYVLALVLVTSRKNVSAGSFFMASIVPLGLIYLILMLPWSTPDSNSHILAANRFSNILMGAGEGEEWMVRAADADYLPQTWRDGTGGIFLPCMEDYARTFLIEKAVADDVVREDKEDGSDMKSNSDGESIAGRLDPIPYFADVKMEYYSILNYLPQVLGLTIGRLLKLDPVPAIYLGRILILAAYIAACAHAIRMAPVGKAVFAGIALLPMSLMFSSAYSYDAMVLISTLCFTAAILRASHEPFRSRFFIESAAWAAVIGGTKGGGYLLLLPLVFLLLSAYRTDFGEGTEKPRRLGGGRRALAVAAAGLLSILVFDLLLPTGTLFQFGGEGTGNLSFSYALWHPFKYLQLLLAAFIQYADHLTLNVGGTMLSWLERTIPAVFIIGLLLLIAVQALFENDRLQFEERDKRVFLTVILLVLLLMPAMLLSWTPIGSQRIEGLQGRYYLPILPLIYFVLTKFRLYRRTDHSKSADTQIGRTCMRWFCGISCICVYYLLRLYLTR